MIAATIVVGFVAWAWAGNAAASTEGNFGNAVAANARYLTEDFSIPDANFSSSAPQNVTVWFYNYGNATVYINQVWISNITSVTSEQWSFATASLSSTTNPECKSNCLVVGVHSVANVTIDAGTTFVQNVTYEIKAHGLYGSSYTYDQIR